VFSVTLRAATSGYDGVTFTITNRDCQALVGYKMHGEATDKARWTADNLVDELKIRAEVGVRAARCPSPGDLPERHG
jgi:hypothetical protein